MRDNLYILSNLLVLLVFLSYFLSMPHLKNRRNRIFFRLLVIQAVILLSGVLLGWAEGIPAFLLRWVYDLLLPSIGFLYGRSTLEILNIKPAEIPKRVRLFLAVAVVSEAVILSTVVTGLVIRLESGTPLFGPLYALPALTLSAEAALSLWILRIHATDRLSVQERLSAEACNWFLIAGGILYALFPLDFIVSTVLTACLCIACLIFENPYLFIANRGNAFNMTAFRHTLSERIEKKDYRILAFALRDYIDMRGIYGGTQVDRGVAMIGKYLVLTYPEYEVFYLRSGRFALLGPARMDWEQVRTELVQRFQSPWTTDEVELDLNVTFVQIEPETGLDTEDRILNYLFLAFENAGGALQNPDGLIDTESIRAMDREIAVKRSLERCLENNEVEIFLQPLIASRTRLLTGAEVLCRIRDEGGKLLFPAQFIPIAEKNGYINLMGEQVLEKACQFVRDHDLEAIGLSWLNVNLSPIQCMRKDLSKRFSIIMERYDISTEIIHLEITEQSVMDVSRLEEQIRVLQGIGFRFSLDDYGSGYSNLSRVKQYPFANIKLDMGIVWDYIRDRDVLLPTMVNVFKEMGFSVTAEGIENAEMADAMTALGCDFLQGYYFSRPLPVEEFVAKYTEIRQSV